jgi:phosphatidylglycerophosphatase A
MNPKHAVTDNVPQLPSLLRNPVHFLSLGFGSGLSPKAPGTFGTLAALPIYGLLQLLSPINYLLAVLFAFILGVYACGATARAMQSHDHPAIVWDEFVGLWLTLFLVPTGWVWIVAGFCLFRLFDIVKPWPISWFDRRVHGGFGIMLDDVIAGIFAWCVLQGAAISITRFLD